MQTIFDMIDEVVSKMSLAEKGFLNLVLIHGKNLQNTHGNKLSETSFLEYYGNVSSQDISTKINNAYISGIGLWDAITEKEFDYGLQVDDVIRNVLVKGLKTVNPSFKDNYGSKEGCLSREKWITEKMLEKMWESMPEEAKKEIAEEIRQVLLEKGIEPSKATQASMAILYGGLTAAKAILGFQFHIILTQVSNIILKLLVGKGLTFAGNALMQKLAGLFFGPIGWFVTAVLFIPMITDFFNSREYDKIIPAIFLIGLKRTDLG